MIEDKKSLFFRKYQIVAVDGITLLARIFHKHCVYLFALQYQKTEGDGVA